jgi:hypothetical protein
VRLLLAGAVSLVPVGIVGGLFGQGASAAAPPLSVVAQIPIKDDPGGANSGNEVMLDVAARRALYWYSAKEIRAYDLDTMKQVASAPTSDIAGFAWALDSRTHTLYHFKTTFPPVIEGVDTGTLAARPALTQSLQPQMGDPYAGFFWSERDSLLYMVYAPYALGSGNQITMIAAIDPASTSGNPVLWSATVSGCGQPLGLTANNAEPLGQTKDGKYMFTVCKTGQGSGAIARLALPADPKSTTGVWNGSVTLIPGLVTGQGSSALWVPGFDRMVTMVQSNGGTGWSAYIFDAASMHFVSAPGLFTPPSDGRLSYGSQPPGFGVDPSSGRLFAQSRAITTQGRDPSSGAPCQFLAPGTNSAVVDETAMSGVSLLRFPVSDEGINGAGHFAGFDPVGHNWWMLSQHMLPASSCNPNGSLDASYFIVFHDAVPPSSAPPSVDPDNATNDIAEQAGTTAFNASSDASAYGTRYVLGPSGADGLMATPTNGGTCDLNADFTRQQQTMSSSLPILGAPPAPPQYHSFCNSHGRTATFAHVDNVSLDSSEARATAITGDTDRETGNDVQVGTDASQPGLYGDAVSGYANDTGGAASSGSSGAPVPHPCPTLTPAPATPTPSPTATPIMTFPTPPPSESTTCDQQLQPVQPYLGGLALPYAPARCGDNGTESRQQTSQAPLQAHELPNNSPLTYPGSASVSCSFADQKALGHAQQVSAAVGGPLSDPVASMTATADVAVRRTAATGSEASSTSTVKDISIGSIMHIGSLTATGTATAHGRPGSNGTSYVCRVHGLTVSLPANISLPDGVKSNIPDASCDSPQVQQLVAALDSIFSGQLNIVFPGAPSAADKPVGGGGGAVQRRSPRGYLSEVALSDIDQVQNAILINDNSIEKPAMVVTSYLDNNYSRNRLVTSFAGVAATARYGIFPLDGGGGGGTDGGPTWPAPDSGPLGSPLGTIAPDGGVPPMASSGPSGPSALGGLNPLKVAQAIVDGFRFLMQHPALIPPVLAVWLLFVGPGYLLSRRRALVNATEGAV